jgi:hypothetical protein
MFVLFGKVHYFVISKTVTFKKNVLQFETTGFDTTTKYARWLLSHGVHCTDLLSAIQKGIVDQAYLPNYPVTIFTYFSSIDSTPFSVFLYFHTVCVCLYTIINLVSLQKMYFFSCLAEQPVTFLSQAAHENIHRHHTIHNLSLVMRWFVPFTARSIPCQHKFLFNLLRPTHQFKKCVSTYVICFRRLILKF